MLNRSCGNYSINSIAVDVVNNVYAGTSNGDVYISESGSSWSLIGGDSMPDGGGINSIAVTGINVYAGTDVGDVYFTELNGIWTLIGGGGIPTGGSVTSVVLDSAVNVYAGSSKGYVYIAESGGAWSSIGGGRIPDNSHIHSIAVDISGNVYAGDSDGSVYIAESGGAWSLVGGSNMPDGGAADSIALDNVSNSIYAGTSIGHVYVSKSNSAWVSVGSSGYLGGGNEFLADYTNNTACISGGQCGFSQAYPAVQVPAIAASKYIFITANAYNGNLQTGGGIGSSYSGIPALSGTLGADAICQYEAENNAGTLLPPGGIYKALIISESRYPCNAAGECGESAALNWPVTANAGYLTPKVGGTTAAILSSDSNGIFETTFTSGLITSPDASVNATLFWTGINGILIGEVVNNTSQIIGWSYANNSATWSGGSWSSYSDRTCNSWSSSDSAESGFVGNNGNLSNSSMGTNGLQSFSGYSPFDAWLNDSTAYVSRWVTGSINGGVLTDYACNNSAALVCVMQ